MYLQSPSSIEGMSYDELNRLLSLHGSTFKMELILRLLGLKHARNTMLGSALVGDNSGDLHKMCAAKSEAYVLCAEKVNTSLVSMPSALVHGAGMVVVLGCVVDCHQQSTPQHVFYHT